MAGAASRLVGVIATHATNDNQLVAHARRLPVAHALRSRRLPAALHADCGELGDFVSACE